MDIKKIRIMQIRDEHFNVVANIPVQEKRKATITSCRVVRRASGKTPARPIIASLPKE